MRILGKDLEYYKCPHTLSLLFAQFVMEPSFDRRSLKNGPKTVDPSYGPPLAIDHQSCWHCLIYRAVAQWGEAQPRTSLHQRRRPDTSTGGLPWTRSPKNVLSSSKRKLAASRLSCCALWTSSFPPRNPCLHPPTREVRNLPPIRYVLMLSLSGH